VNIHSTFVTIFNWLLLAKMGQSRPSSQGGNDGIEVADVQQTSIELQQKDKKDISHVERILSPTDDDDLRKEDMDFDRVDKEIQMYVGRGAVEIDEATNARLKKLIDRRVLVIMILTYFLQALDKGTMSFASIMGIKTDAGLENGQKVCALETSFGLNITDTVFLVFLANNLYLHRRPGCRVPHKLDHPACSYCQIPWNQHLHLGCNSSHACCLPQLRWTGCCSYIAGYFRGMLSAHLRSSLFNVVQA
jgi:hypothetical protein